MKIIEKTWLYKNGQNLSNKDLTSVWQEAKANKINAIDISKNNFTTIDFPTFEMPDVKILELSYNQSEIEKLVIDAAIFPNVEYIFAYQSNIKSFQIKGNLPKLRELNLRENQLKTISKNLLLQCPALEYIVLKDNQLGNPPQSLFEEKENGLGNLRSFWHNLASGKVKVYQAKIIIIGNGRVGKTCLVKRWLLNEFDENEKSTHAIQIYHKALEELAQDKKVDFDYIQLNIWDFGGQDIYHATHKIFMQTKGLFLLVWDFKTEAQDHCKDDKGIQYQNFPIQYWFEYARHEGKKNPVLLIQTKINKEGHKVFTQPNINELREKYNLLREIHTDSQNQNNDEEGFEDLHFEIERYIKNAIKSQEETTEIPTTWWNIQLHIQDLQDTLSKNDLGVISTQDFHKICEDNQLTDTEDINILQRYFHNTGLFFVLGNQIIIDQKKSIEAVYTLFDREKIYHTYLKTEGIFTGKDLKVIWQNYSTAEQSLFIDFMLKCEVCFEIEKIKNEYGSWKSKPFEEKKYLAPSLLSETKPDSQLRFWKDKKTFVRYQFSFLHYGILQSIIVRSREYAKTENMWRYGTELEDEKGLILIEGCLEKSKNYIDVFYDNEESKDLLQKFDNTLLDLQGRENFTKQYTENGCDFSENPPIFLKENQTNHQEKFEVKKTNPTKNPIENMLQHYETFRSEFQVSIMGQTPDLLREIRKNYPMNNTDKSIFDGIVDEFISRSDNFNFQRWKDKIIAFLDRLTDEPIKNPDIPTSKSNNEPKTTSNMTTSNIPESFITELKKQISDEYVMIADTNLRRSVTRDTSKKQEYEDLITACEENIAYSEKRFLKNVQNQNQNITENEVKKLILELKEEIKKGFENQNLKMEELFAYLEESHKPLLIEILQQRSEEDLALMKEMYAKISEIKSSEANIFLEELSDNLPANLPQREAIQTQLNSMEVTTNGKLKLAIPIIPSILSYEIEVGKQWTDKIPKVWQSITSLFKKKK